MAGESGKNGKVLVGSTTVAEVTGWTLNRTSNNPSWGSSSVAGEKQRVAGVKDATGSFDFKYDPADRIHSAISEGDAVTLNLYTNATDYFVVPAVVDGITYTVDMNDGDITGGTCNFSQTAAITEPS
jgi:hypothetical protein